MKIRTDFVTNSSSSSFIVVFDKKPTSKEELLKMMFWDEDKQDIIPSIHFYEYWENTEHISETVFNDINHENKNIWKDIRETIECILYNKSYYKEERYFNKNRFGVGSFILGSYDQNNDNDIVDEFIKDTDIPDSPKMIFHQKTGLECWYNLKDEKEKYKKIFSECYSESKKECTRIARNIVKRIKRKYKDKFIWLFTYSDENQKGSVLEHGGIFRKLPHMTISNH